MGFEFECEAKGNGEGDKGEVAGTCQCRICHEEEPAKSTSMESPCACSGSLQFAHRRCVQRWCDEKGSTVCEICLENFQRGYVCTVAPTPKKAQPVDVAATIRRGLEAPRLYHGAIDLTNLNSGYMGCSDAPPVSTSISTSTSTSTSRRGASCCRSLAITLAALLLLRHLMDVLFVAADQNALSLLIMFALRAVGILLPCFVVLRLISAIQHGQQQYQLVQIQIRRGEERVGIDMSGRYEENPHHCTIQILS